MQFVLCFFLIVAGSTETVYHKVNSLSVLTYTGCPKKIKTCFKFLPVGGTQVI